MKLIVVAGPPNSGKMPLAQSLVAKHCHTVLIHRDRIRDAIGAIDESHMTLTMVAVVQTLLQLGHEVVTVSQNLHVMDRARWEAVAQETGAQLEWMDTRDPEVHKLIPPLEGWKPHER